ncbi:hypothetical protein GE061_002476 [Apolygus lucorum]|uniref:Uncharacterized protein n=1 Tax=Apolygus lucorum TaxID=248454 RepID=A0A6A4J7V5_APOLU|nr:hypothetical protein GE061_002476 [Apolygus lucorum]
MAEVKAIQPENDVFCSVYRKDYVFWKDYDHRTQTEHFDSYRLTPEKAEEFLQFETKADFSKMEQYMEDMKELNKLRLRTLYSLEYAPKSSYKILRNVDPDKFSPKNDKFLIDGAVLFGVPQGKVPIPLPTSRRVFGYSTYDDYRNPLSTYQDIHGRLGYDRVKKAAEGGYWRMGPKYDHEKELTEIKNILKREGNISEREKEEKLLAEEMIKKQLEEERTETIRRSVEKQNSRKRGTMLSNRFGSDPRQPSKSSGSPMPENIPENSKKESDPHQEVPESKERSLCSHTVLEHEECLKRKKLCEHSEEKHKECQIMIESNTIK